VITELRQNRDEDIRERLAARDYRPAFDSLVERYKDKVFRLGVSMLRNETQAEDVTQEIFLRIWKALPGFQGQASLSTWIYAITRNCCLTELKKQSARPTDSLSRPEIGLIAEEFAASETNVAASGAEMDVQWMLTRIPEKYRRVITLFYLEQKSYEEVAAMLGLPLGTVKTFLHRGKKELIRLAGRQRLVATA
jgi:RNA polymerase sigma-70 factor (ECF subfamily)